MNRPASDVSETRREYPAPPSTRGLWLVFLFLGLTCRANTLTLGWDPVVDATGYRVYWGTASRNYDHSADAGDFTMYTVTHLVNTITYYFAVTAYNEAGESDYSAEISETIADLPTPDFLVMSLPPEILTWTIDYQQDTQLGFEVLRHEVGMARTNLWLLADPFVRSLAQPDLLPCSDYEYVVRGYTAWGSPGDLDYRLIYSPPSSPYFFATLPQPYLGEPAFRPIEFTAAGGVRLILLDTPGSVESVESSDDLVNWSPLGKMDEVCPGQYRIVDPSISRQRFYRIAR